MSDRSLTLTTGDALVDRHDLFFFFSNALLIHIFDDLARRTSSRNCCARVQRDRPRTVPGAEFARRIHVYEIFPSGDRDFFVFQGDLCSIFFTLRV